MNFRISFKVLPKKVAGIFIAIALKLSVICGSIDMLTILSPLIHKREMSRTS